MISPEDVQIAVEAAVEAIKSEPGFTWIKRSALLERAYMLGLLQFVQALSDDSANAETTRLLMGSYCGTFFTRDGDDSFPSTNIGQAFAKLRGVTRSQNLSSETVGPALTELLNSVETSLNRANSTYKHIESLLAPVLSSVQSHDDLGRLLRDEEHLEHLLRDIALLEIDHIWSRRLRPE